MFLISREEAGAILRDYGITAGIRALTELQRYHYEQDDPDSREVRLIVRIDLEAAPPLVIRFKNEEDVTLELVESQSRFAAALKNAGIITPRQYLYGGSYAHWYRIGGYDVIVTLEDFAENELRVVDEGIAQKTGALLARMHSIAEQQDLHVDNDVLFDPFGENDLFAYDDLAQLAETLTGEDRALARRITERYESCMAKLAPLKARPGYAVQGDISDCNLYLTADGAVGIFDFNRSGDNILFCDAVMQAVFEARLMDYPEDRGEDFEARLLSAFLEGYCAVRPFSAQEQEWAAILCTIIDAFWAFDIRWREDGLMNAHKAGDAAKVRQWLETIWKRLDTPRLRGFFDRTLS